MYGNSYIKISLGLQFNLCNIRKHGVGSICQFVQEVVTSNPFPICFEFNEHVVNIYKTLLDRVPLRFNSSLLFHSLFDAYMQQNFDMFSKHVNPKG